MKFAIRFVINIVNHKGKLVVMVDTEMVSLVERDATGTTSL